MAINEMGAASDEKVKKNTLSNRVLAAEIASGNESKSKHFPTAEKLGNIVKGFVNPQGVFDTRKMEKKAAIDAENLQEQGELRRGFLDKFAVNLNPDTPAKDKMTNWVWDKRFSTANIISPDGFCYALKVENSKEYMEAFSELMKNLGIKQDSLEVYTPVENPGIYTNGKKERMENLQLIGGEDMTAFTPKRFRKA